MSGAAIASEAGDAPLVASDVVAPTSDAPSDLDGPADVTKFDFDAPPSCGPQMSMVDGSGGGGADADAGGDTICDYIFSCGLPPGVAPRGCEVVAIELDGGPRDATPLRCRLVENRGCVADAFSPTESGAITMECPDCLSGTGGRWTAGLATPRMGRRRTTGAGGYFARLAHAEAASVLAFDRLRDELAVFAAPAAILRAAKRASRDEVRHARAIGALATARAGTPPPVRERRRPKARTLEAIARENAVEGCVYETWNALVAQWQATHAEDGHSRRTFRAIAVDELRHAALAWTVAAWAEARLNEAARARIHAARTRAARSLRTALAARRTADFDHAAGLPDGRTALALADKMLDALELDASS